MRANDIWKRKKVTEKGGNDMEKRMRKRIHQKGKNSERAMEKKWRRRQR